MALELEVMEITPDLEAELPEMLQGVAVIAETEIILAEAEVGLIILQEVVEVKVQEIIQEAEVVVAEITHLGEVAGVIAQAEVDPQVVEADLTRAEAGHHQEVAEVVVEDRSYTILPFILTY